MKAAEFKESVSSEGDFIRAVETGVENRDQAGSEIQLCREPRS